MSSTLALLHGEPAVHTQPDLRWPPIGEAEIEAVTRLLRDRELSYYGREGEVARLEDGFRERWSMPYALAVSSGTAALHSAYFGLGLQPGDEVIVPTYTFLATVTPLFLLNAVPVLCDAEADTGNLDAADIERHITNRTRAIVVTHLWGHPCEMEAISAVARRHGLALVEDCSHAHGAAAYGRQVGTFGDVSIFSLQAKKLVAAGQGGILLTRDREIYERAILLGHFKVRAFQEVTDPAYRPYCNTGFGMNYRMHPLAAAIANVQLADLDRRIAGRVANMERLSSMLRQTPGTIPAPRKAYADRHVYYSYKALYDQAALEGIPIGIYVNALRAEGVAIEKSETLPLHLEPVFAKAGHPMRSHGVPESFAGGAPMRTYSPGDFPRSEEYSQLALALPVFTEPADEVLEQYGEAFRKVARNTDALRAYALRYLEAGGRSRPHLHEPAP